VAFDTYSIRYFIKEHGVVTTLKKRTKGAYNSTTGSVSFTTVDHKVYGFSYKASPESLQENSVVTSMRKVIVSAIKTNHKPLPLPTVDDQIVINGTTYDILKVSDVKSANNVIFYTLDVRG
jgi:hypothetical protein